jgi:hypothetical protein
MATYTYVGTVKLSNGSTQKVTVQADTSYNATAMLETQYGKGKVFNVMRA